MGESDMSAGLFQPTWELIACIRVAEAEKVRCQCEGCTKTVYAQIHIVRLAEGVYRCWGCECYRKMVSGLPRGDRPAPVFPHVGGRQLTDEERQLLGERTEALVERFRIEHEQALQAAAEAASCRTVRSDGTMICRSPSRHRGPMRDPDMPDASGSTPQERINAFAIELGRRKREERGNRRW